MTAGVCLALVAIMIGLLGAIPSGVLFAWLFKTADPRQIGSGNIGATNMLRTGNKTAAAATLLADALKAIVGLWLGRLIWEHWVGGDVLVHYPFLYLLPVVGHVFSPFLGFKGGKGIATALGTLLFFSYPVACALLAVWGLTFYLTRISSISGLTAVIACAILFAILYPWSEVAWALGLCMLIIFTHRQNIGRLLKQEEKKIDAEPYLSK